MISSKEQSDRCGASISRRDFVKSATTIAVATAGGFAVDAAERKVSERPGAADASIIDTNIYLGEWPFRRVSFESPAAFLAKLKRHSVAQAWAGSFEGLFHKDIAAVNARLREACRRHGDGVLVPIGSVNPSWPGWEDDVRRCREEFHMRGIRLHPNYHGYSLNDPKFERLMHMAAERGLLVQLVASMEDSRVQHPLLKVAPLFSKPEDARALAKVVKGVPGLRMELLNALQFLRGDALRSVVDAGNVAVDSATLEGVGGLERLLQTLPSDRVVFGSYAPVFIFESAELKLQESALGPEQRMAVLSRNAELLLHGKAG